MKKNPMAPSPRIDEVGRMKKLKKNMSSEKQAAALDYASPSLSGKTKKKRKMKIKSLMPEEKAVAAEAAYASTPPPTEKKEKEKRRKKKAEQMMQDVEEKKPVAEGNEDRKPSLYLVVQHAAKRPAYSLFEVKHTQMTAEHPLPFPYRVKYLDAQHNMSFVALCSPRRSWIVGVGGSRGDQGQTIVFDCKTEAVAKGPNLTEGKYTPVVVTVGEKVYALCHMPSMWMSPDFPPWFEVLDLSGASCVDGQLTCCTWRPLPSPPLFDRGPPIVEVESYAVVGHYILVSVVCDPFTEKDAGTVAFDMIAEEWLDLDDQRNLPFIGQAVPYGRLFLGWSKSKVWNDFTAYDINVTETKTNTRITPMLSSIMEVPISVGMTSEYETPLISGRFFASLGNGVICAVGCSTECWTGGEEIEKDNVYMNFHSPISGEQEQQAGKIVLSSTPSKYFFRLHEPACRLIAPSLVAAPCLTLI